MSSIALPAPFETPPGLIRLPRWARPWERTKDDVLVEAVAVANSWGVTGAATTSQTVTISGVQVGELLIAIGYAFSNTTETYNTPAFTDNGTGSSWTNRADSGWVQRNRVIIGETVVGSSAPTTVTVTLTSAAGQDMALVVLRVTGAASSNTHDASVANSSTSATPSTGALTTTNANDLIVLGLTHDGATTSLTKPTGFTQSADAAGNSTNSSAASEPYASAWQVVSSIQSAATYQWTLGASRNAVMVAGGWKAAATGKGIIVDQRRGPRNSLLRRHHEPRVSVYMSRPAWRSRPSGILVPSYT